MWNVYYRVLRFKRIENKKQLLKGVEVTWVFDCTDVSDRALHNVNTRTYKNSRWIKMVQSLETHILCSNLFNSALIKI